MVNNLQSVNNQACCHTQQFDFHGQPTDVCDHYGTELLFLQPMGIAYQLVLV